MQHAEKHSVEDKSYSLQDIRSLKETLEEITESWGFPLADPTRCDEDELVCMIEDVWYRTLEIAPTLGNVVGNDLSDVAEIFDKIYDQPFLPTKSEIAREWNGSKYVEVNKIVPENERDLRDRYDWINGVKSILEGAEEWLIANEGAPLVILKEVEKKVMTVDPNHFQRKCDNWKLLCGIINDSTREGVPCESRRTLRSLKERLKGYEKEHGTSFGYRELANSMRYKDGKARTVLSPGSVALKLRVKT